jgi:hypothetical protein
VHGWSFYLSQQLEHTRNELSAMVFSLPIGTADAQPALDEANVPATMI